MPCFGAEARYSPLRGKGVGEMPARAAPLLARSAAGEVGEDHAGRDTVASDALRPEGDGEAFHQHVQAGLGGGVVALLGGGDIHCEGSDEDDPAALAALDHLCGDELGAVECAVQVHVHGLLKHRFAHLHDIDERADAGV